MAELIDATIIEQADQLKEQGNKFLAQNRYKLAVEKYTSAIELREHAIYYSNRAQAYIKMDFHGLAIIDANAAIKCDPKYVKAYYRRGSANFALGKPKLALKDFKAVHNIKPNDADAAKKMSLCDKVIKANMFSQAIECNYENAVAPTMDYNVIEVPDSYKGPRLEDDGVVTKEFVIELMEFFKDQKALHKRYVLQIMAKYEEIVVSSPSLLYIQLPKNNDSSSAGVEDTRFQNLSDENDNRRRITVCGDTHGQFYDLCNIFRIGGFPSVNNPYLFNGDYVDRGSFSFENIFTLMCWKLVHPNCIYMLRGNHETKNMNKIYGFEGEVLHKYDKMIMGAFTHIFNNMPISACIQNSVFVTHGGLSTVNHGAVTLEEVSEIQRNREPKDTGLMSDLMWSGKKKCQYIDICDIYI